MKFPFVVIAECCTANEGMARPDRPVTGEAPPE